MTMVTDRLRWRCYSQAMENTERNRHIIADLTGLYQRAHGELHQLEGHEPEPTDQSPEAITVRAHLSLRREWLRELGVLLMSHQRPPRVGEHLVPYSPPPGSLN